MCSIRKAGILIESVSFLKYGILLNISIFFLIPFLGFLSSNHNMTLRTRADAIFQMYPSTTHPTFSFQKKNDETYGKFFRDFFLFSKKLIFEQF